MKLHACKNQNHLQRMPFLYKAKFEINLLRTKMITDGMTNGQGAHNKPSTRSVGYNVYFHSVYYMRY